jgi:hypothetical protein
MSRKWLLLIVFVALATCAGIFWKVRDTQVRAARLESEILKGLSTEDIVMMLENQALVEPSKTFAVVQAPETRRVFLNGLREYLAMAARARREGMADDPNIRISLEYKRNQLLAGIYHNKLDNDLGRYYEIPNEQIDAFVNDRENEKEFQNMVQALRSIQKSVALNSGNPAAAPDIQGEALEKARKDWAKTMILSNTAKGDPSFVNQPAIQLRLKVAEAGVLAFNYLNKYWALKVKPDDKEIDSYLAAHPEFDVNKKHETARMVLDRARSGDDLGKLAREFSEDRSTKDKGGLYADVVSGVVLPELEAAALKLEKGQVAPDLVETQYGFHIVQLVDRRTAKDEGGRLIEKFSIRHVLLRKAFEDPASPKLPNVPPPFLTPREIATSAVQNEKRQRFVDEVIAAEKITLPEDFTFEITKELQDAGTRWDEIRDKIEKDKRSRAADEKNK